MSARHIDGRRESEFTTAARRPSPPALGRSSLVVMLTLFTTALELPSPPFLARHADVAEATEEPATTRVSISTDGVQGGGDRPSISGDGRFVAFLSGASNLVSGDTNNKTDIFVHDRSTGETSRVSVSSSGTQSNNWSWTPSISADGRYVTFQSWATNLTPGDANLCDTDFDSQADDPCPDILVHDRDTGTTESVSVDSSETQANGWSSAPSISGNGRYIAFQSSATNLVTGDTNGTEDVFLRDRQEGTTVRVSVSSTGTQSNSLSSGAKISDQGGHIAFGSLASNLVAGDTNGYHDVFVHARDTGTTSRVSVSSSGLQGNAKSGYDAIAISADGRYVVFDSDAYNFTPGEVAGFDDFFVHDRINAQTTMVSVDSMGREGTCCNISDEVDISSDGRYVAFGSSSLDLVCGDTRLDYDIMVHDRTLGRTTRVSVGSAGQQGNGGSFYPSISDDGRHVAFSSVAPNLVPDDTNGQGDVFVHDRSALPQKLCVPLKHTYGTGIHGLNPTATQSDPVNSATGSFTTSATDISLPGIGVPFLFKRHYNSMDSTVGALGRGWTHSLAASLNILANENIVLRGEDGQQLDYKLEADGTFTPNTGGRSELRTISGGYELLRHDQVKYRFNTAGRLTELRDRNDKGLALAYDANGRLSTVTDGAGRSIGFTHDASGRLTQIDLSDGRNVRYGYTSGRLTSLVDLRGKTWAFAYDTAGRLTTITDPANYVLIRNVYNAAGRVIEQYDAFDNKSTFSWDSATQTSTMTDARGGIWQDVYSNNILLRRIDPLGNTTTYEYDSNLNLTSRTDPRGHSVTMTYDTTGNVLTITAPAPLSYQRSFSYDSQNNVVSAANGRGYTTTFEFDAPGNLIKVTRPGNNVILLDRDQSGTGLLTTFTDPRGKVTEYEYDNDGNLAQVISSLGNKTTMSYDGFGRMVSMVEPRGNETGADPDEFRWSFTYDSADHLLTQTSPLGHSTTWEYEARGLLAARTDAKNRTTEYLNNAAGELASVVAPDGNETSYEYDVSGNLTARTDSKGRVTRYQYDLTNRVTQASNPLGNAWTYEYDAAGNITQKVDARGNATLRLADRTTSYDYDELNRLAGIDYSDSTADVSFVYDANGNRTAMTDGLGTETYSYDALDRLTAVIRGSQSFSYVYDVADHLTQRTYPDGTTVDLTYDDDGHLATVLSNSGTTTYSYDAAGFLISTALPNGYLKSRTFDADGRLTEINNASGSSVLSSFSYNLDEVGNPTALADAAGTTTTYAYDALDRITEVCFDSPCSLPTDDAIRYEYDAVGNRTSEVGPSGPTFYVYDDADRLVVATHPDRRIAYAYDENGNQILAGSRMFAYDMADRTVSTTQGLKTITYSYDGNGNRTQASSGSSAAQVTNYQWDINARLPEVVAERDGAGTLLRRYVHGEDLISMFTGGQDYYYHQDRIGSVTDLTSSTGTPTLSYAYEPYGTERSAPLGSLPTGGSPSPTNLMRFTGELYDADTGLYHLRARQYDPKVGRFLATDPLAPSISSPLVGAYVYANNRPTLLTDPSGLRAESRCWENVEGATLTDYLFGWACPPPLFDYNPQLVKTSYGWRAIDPFGDVCSFPAPDKGPYFDFTVPCLTHDYAYDLVKFGIGTEGEADDLFALDAFESCEAVSIFERGICEDAANIFATGLALTDLIPGK